MLERLRERLALFICPRLKELDSKVSAVSYALEAHRELLNEAREEFARSCKILHDGINEGVNHSIENRQLRERVKNLETALEAVEIEARRAEGRILTKSTN